MNQDESHLDNLAIAHYVVGGVMALFSCMPLLHMFIGLSFILGGDSFFPEDGQQPPAFFGWMFFTVGLFFFVMGQATSISIVISGRFLKRRKNYLFTFILACLACIFVPFGTVLGIFTIIVLSRGSVREIYERKAKVADITKGDT